MRNLKKILALVLAMVMTFSVMATANAFTDDASIDADYAEAVEVLAGLGVLKGYEVADDEYAIKPQNSITRAEVAAMIYRVVTGDVEDTQAKIYASGDDFTDVNADAWYAGYVGFCANAEYIKGYPDGSFKPNGKVTGYEALVMILRALGYGEAGEFVGESWAINAGSRANKLGITENVTSAQLKAAASREVVAEIIFQAFQKNQVVYTALAEYEMFKNISLAKEVFGLVKGDRQVIDNWGRPGYFWFADGEEIATIEEAYKAKFTTKVTECDISAAAFSGKSASNLICWVNGAELAQTYSIQNTDVYTKLGAQGRLTEIYKDRIVMIDTLLAKVENVTTIKYDAAGHRINTSDMTLIVYDGSNTRIVLEKTSNWAYAKGDYVLINAETTTKGDLFAATHYAVNDVDTVVLGLAESFVGAQTIIHYNDGKHTIDGVDYMDASCFHKNDAGISAAKYTWFKDQYGNVIGSAVIPTTYEFGVIKNIQWFTQAGAHGYAQATMVMMDGTEKSIVVSAIADHADETATVLTYALNAGVNLAEGRVSTEIKNNFSRYSGTDLYRIADNGNGTYTLVDVANTIVGGTEEQGVTVTTGAHVMGSTLVDSETQYLVRVVSATADDENKDGVKDATIKSTYTAVTGYNNIAKYNNAVVDYVDTDEDGRAELVYIVGESAAANGAGLFYRSSTTNSYYVPVTGTVSDYYVLTGYVNGKLDTIKTESVAIRDAIIAADADTLFDIELTDGYVTDYKMISNVDTLLHASNVGPYTDLYATSCEGFSVYYDKDALTLVGYTAGWNVTEATRVVGTLVEGETYSSDKWTVHVVFDKATKNAVEIYVFENVDGGTSDMNPSAPVTTTVTYVVNFYDSNKSTVQSTLTEKTAITAGIYEYTAGTPGANEYDAAGLLNAVGVTNTDAWAVSYCTPVINVVTGGAYEIVLNVYPVVPAVYPAV